MRRSFLFALVTILAFPWACDRPEAPAPAEAQMAAEPHFTSPPGPETPEIQAQIAKLRQALESKASHVSAVLTDPAHLPLHERTSFRELIARHARQSRLKIVTPKEPGSPLVVTGTVRRPDGGPLGGALVYVYQTDARGWYSDRAPHISGMQGDEEHARLFGYLTTDANGGFVLETIRPAGYPRSDLPQHIHIEVFEDGQSRLVSEITFLDDPRMTPAARRRGEQNGFFVVPVEHGAGGVQRCRVEIKVR